MPQAVEEKFNLLGAGQDSYAGQNAQDPRTSRKIQSWLLQEDGQLHRELAEPEYASNTLGGPIVGLYEFDQTITPPGQTVAVVNRYYFAAARTNNTVGTKTCKFYQNVAGAWQQVTAVGTLTDAPMCVTQENNFFLADGTSNWLFDGTIWVPVGIDIPLNMPAISASTGTSQIFFDTNGVTIYFFATGAPFKGAPSLTFPTSAGSATASATKNSASGASLLFNPPQFNGTTDPNVQPLEWATLNSSGTITGYTVPWSGATQGYEASIVCNLVFPSPGQYNISFNHDDGAFFGFGPGSSTGGQINITSGGPVNVFQSLTAIQGYPVLAGTAKSGNWNESFTIQVSEADTYPLEIIYTNWENEQQLVFQISQVKPNSPVNPNPLPSTGTVLGNITAALGRYYWYTNADQTAGVATESSSSPIGVVSGPITSGSIKVYQQPGFFTSSSTSPTVTGSNTTDNPGPVAPDLQTNMVGKVIYINGTQVGTIASVGVGATLNLTAVSAPASGNATYTGLITGGADNALAGAIFTITGFVNSSNNISNAVVLSSTSTSLVFANPNSVSEVHAATATSPSNTLTLTANAAVSIANGRAVIVDSRCTHWNVYASESDGSKIGQYLFSVPVTQNLTTTPYVDTSAFLDSPSNTFLPVFRPVRNDRPVPSKILEVHKVRQWRRLETNPIQIFFTANEEVTSGNNGDPAQCEPGAASYTVSDMINEVPYPDQSARLRSLTSHMDSLYMFTEKSCYPLYGNSVDDFAIAQVIAFPFGSAGRFAVKSTTNGLIFVTYDKKVYLFPTSLYSGYLAQSGASASSLIEIGKPLRNVLKQIASSRLDEVVVTPYKYGIRDWVIFSFPTSATQDTPQAWVYDFADKGWFQLQRGFSSLAVFEAAEGEMVLIGGGVDGNTYVIDDQNGIYANTGNLPQATWQPALINFGNEEVAHKFNYLEFEFDSQQLANSVQITVWLDPNNVDNPGVGRTLHLRPALGANRYRAFLTGNAICQRMLVQLVAPSNQYSGVIRGIKLVSETVPGLITGANKPGGF